MIMLNRFTGCNILSIFWILPSNRQQWWESTMNWRYSRCTDWKFYTWFHLNSTNGYIIAPFHHFPSLGDIKGSSLRKWNKDEYIQLGTWAMLKSHHAYFYLSFSWEKKKNILFDLDTIKVPPRICWSCLLVEITRCTFNQRLIHHPPFVFSLKHDLTSSPGWFSSIKIVQPCSKATDGQRQTQPDSGSPSQLLWHVRHAGMPCHSPLLHCNKGWADSPLERQAQVARRDVRRDGAPVSRPRVHPQTSFQSIPSFFSPPSPET